MESNKLLKEADVAEMLGVSILTLRKWRCYGKGPEFRRLARRVVRYPSAGILRYVESCERGGAPNAA
ncbi:MAG: hypothetical protein IPM24_26920 [Bryobacterales bacterium]|nr:hypothetical protein [Bryobacterales bacterium]